VIKIHLIQRPMKTHPFRAGVALLFVLLALGACSKRPTPTQKDQPVIPVRVQTVESKPHVAFEEVTGSVRPKLQTSIAPENAARIEKMLVAPGQKIKRGETLVQLDPRDAQAKLEQARAILEQAEKSLQRQTALLASHATSQADYDTALANQRVAKATVAQAETALNYRTITAPFDGVITKKLADVGDLASPYKAILEMEDPGVLRFEADVPEALIAYINNGASLTVRIGAATVTGIVCELTPVADPQTRTFLVKLDLPPTPGLRTGQFGRAMVPVSETHVLRVSASSLVQRGQMEMVFVVAQGRAQLRLVKTGKRFDDEVEVVSGIEAGEQVALEKAATLTDGQRVEALAK
jgi:RND family efflux transporter MFP subunit